MERREKDSAIGVKVSPAAQSKAKLLDKYLTFSSENNRSYGKDAMLLRSNLLVPEVSKNYRVLLAFKSRAASTS